MGRNYDGIDDFGEQAKEKLKSGFQNAGQKAANVGSKAIQKGSQEVIKGFRSAKSTAADSIQKAIASGQAPASMGTISGVSAGAGTSGSAAGAAATGTTAGAAGVAAGTTATAAGTATGTTAGGTATGVAAGGAVAGAGVTAAETTNPVGWIILIVEAVIIILLALYIFFCAFSLIAGEDGQNLFYLNSNNKGSVSDYDTEGSYLADKDKLSSGNLATLAYYELLSSKTVLQEGKDENGNKVYIPYNDPSAKHDRFERDKDLAIDYNILYAFNQKVFSNDYVFPEAILNPVAHDKDYNLCAIQDENGNLNTLFTLGVSNMSYIESKDKTEDSDKIVTTGSSGGESSQSDSDTPTKKEEKRAEKELKKTQKAEEDKVKIKDDDLVLVRDYIPDIQISLAYATSDNFVKQAVYSPDFGCYLRYGTVKKLKVAHEKAKENGYGGLLIWDAYRPQSAVNTLYNAYPDKNYVAQKSNHTKGNTVDLTVVDASGKPVEMPSSFDTFDATADTDYSDCNKTQKSNSEFLTGIMTDAGFKGYNKEWWHFSDTKDYGYQEELKTDNGSSASNTSATVSDKGDGTTASTGLEDIGISTLCSYKQATASSYLKGTYTSKVMVNTVTGEEKIVPLEKAIEYNIPLGTETFDVLDKTVSMWESCTYHYVDVESCVAEVTEGRSANPNDNVNQIQQEDEKVKEKVKQTSVIYPVVDKNGKTKKEFKEKKEAEDFAASHSKNGYRLGTEYEKTEEVEMEVTYNVYYLRSETSGKYQSSCSPSGVDRKTYDNTYLYQYLETASAKCPQITRDYSIFEKLSSYAGVSAFTSSITDLFDGTGNSKESNSQKQFIEWVAPVAIEEAHHTGIYPSLTIAQCIEEGGWGSSSLAKSHFNHVGIKGAASNNGSKIEFWDGTTYSYSTCIMNNSTWMDFSSAVDKDEGLKNCIRYYGRNFWKTSCYGKAGVLNHISAGLSPAEAKTDALKQLSEYAPMYCEGNEYYDKIKSHCDKYNLWQYDEIFLKEGGWDGTVPYDFGGAVSGGSSGNVVSSSLGTLNEEDSKTFSMFYHAVDADILKDVKGLQYETVKFGLCEEDVDDILHTANRFTFGLSKKEEQTQWDHDDLLDMSLLVKDRNHGADSGEATTGDWVFYLQYQGEWATKMYGHSSYASSGCGPTSLAMVVATFCDPTVTPDKVGELLIKKGYRTANQGTAHGYVIACQSDFGYYAEKYDCGEAGIKEKVDNCLRTGGAVVWSSGSQPFTSQGHCMAMRGITSDGKWLLADPNDNDTKKHNEKEWDPSFIMARWHGEVNLIWKEKP